MLYVHIVSVTAFRQNKNVVLTWRTATEHKSAYFEIYRSAHSNTTQTYIGSIEASGNSNTPIDYTFTDYSAIGGKYIYHIYEVDISGTRNLVATVEIDFLAPYEYRLSNYPNPFNPTTSIDFTVPVDEHVMLSVYNILGQKVATLYNGIAHAGEFYSVLFNAEHFSSGVFFCVLESRHSRMVREMLLLK